MGHINVEVADLVVEGRVEKSVVEGVAACEGEIPEEILAVDC